MEQKPTDTDGERGAGQQHVSALRSADIGDGEIMRRSALVIALGLIANGLILAIDLTLPRQYATAILYAVPILAAFWLPSPRATIILALAGSACSVIGYAMTPVAPPSGPIETMIYRIAALAVLWGTAILAIRHQISRALAERSTTIGRHQTALLQAILDTAPDALIVIDKDGVIQSFSRSAELLFGYDAADAIGRNIVMLMPHGDREEHHLYLERYLRTGERRIIGIGRVVEAETKDGITIPVELSVGEARVSNHRVFIGFIRDLSARMRIEEELRQAQKMEAIGQLTGGIAHDFNNLLLVIAGNLELIEAHPERPDPIALKEAREAVELGTNLTARLLAFGRKQALDPKEVDLAELVDGVASMLRRTLGDEIEIILDIRDTPGKAVVDAAQLQTALINLAINARDAMPDGGRLVISVFDTELDANYARNFPEVRLGRYIAVQVTDNGAGMDEEAREHAFEPFFTTKPLGTGNGLGLSMVYGFAKQSNGHVEIDSARGRGTTVTLYLPHAEDERRRARPAQAETTAEMGRGETILVVEDDPRVRRVAVARLREIGYLTAEASSGPDALRQLRTMPHVDLLFTDVVMSDGMSGFELARLARAEMPRLRILFTSGYAGLDTVSRETNMLPEMSEMLRKPYSRQKLARTVRTILDKPD
ncbi:PAS domain S-box protein [Acuticoccus sp. M5D2P5]|uniref:PAS domain-containing sensor histidine kinase n=1 Tax=Acuticoccus kalidii TaxID=2910977 RepID=UPI001F17A1DF|nr:PAS domain-containing sensor histidine kinase [Acuticoccus kalidii]MCF3934824.1 PAS domain S-box protein [Acuticoccus kalidii]